MIVNIVGWIALVLAVLDVILIFTWTPKEKLYQAELCFCLYLICAAICFK